MTLHFIREMDNLHRDLVTMCSMVEEHISDAVEGLINQPRELGAELAGRDKQVDEWDVHIEEECLKILALYHPVAHDLRRVAAVMKITGELERVADLSVSIAQRADGISAFPGFPIPDRLAEMSQEALSMLHSSIDAYVESDSQLARSVCSRDDGVDALNVELLNETRSVMQSRPEFIEPAMHLFSAIRHIERVADHATNIAEDVVYLVEGEIIRHPGLQRST
ncbi:MAG: phosphate signaling complex protein PhoU [Planctomycetaceae bacterium]